MLPLDPILVFFHTHTHSHIHNTTLSPTNPGSLSPSQDDCSPAGVCDPVLAAVEVHPVPAAAMARVQTHTGRTQEGRAQTSPAAAEEGLA